MPSNFTQFQSCTMDSLVSLLMAMLSYMLDSILFRKYCNFNKIRESVLHFIHSNNNMVTEQPLGQLPLYKSTDGELIMSNSIARYVAKRYGRCADYPNDW